MLKRLIKIAIIYNALILILAGCALISTASKTPFEWITLANSGLSGKDDYTYRAHVETGINQNIKTYTHNFDGEVHSHHEYTISGEEVDGTILHPAKYMDLINQKDNTITQVVEPVDPNATAVELTFKVDERSENATTRWRTLLLQQFEQVKLSAEHYKSDLSTKQKTDLNLLFEQSEARLMEMLNTLQVDSHFYVTINPNEAIPTKIEERASLNYIKDGAPFNEYRNSTVHLQYK